MKNLIKISILSFICLISTQCAVHHHGYYHPRPVVRVVHTDVYYHRHWHHRHYHGCGHHY